MGTIPLPLLGFDDANFASPDEKSYECNYVGDVIVFVTGNNRRCTKAPVDEERDEKDGILIK